jgi:hypothetical protein
MPQPLVWDMPRARSQQETTGLSRFRGMMNTAQLAAPFLSVAIFGSARLAARSFILARSAFFGEADLETNPDAV